MSSTPPQLHTQALLQSLLSAPLLVDNLPQAAVFPRQLLKYPDTPPKLNYSQKLGHLFEDALEQLICVSPDLKLLAKNWQINDQQKRTLGEMDFLLWDRKNQQHIQLELAVKFYLIFEDNTGFHYPGPDPRDNWLNKLNRMNEHQFKLHSSPTVKQALKKDFEIESISVQQLICGCLFEHIATTHPNHQPPAIAQNCRHSHWLYPQEWSTHFPKAKTVAIIPKHLWPVLLTSELAASLPQVTVDTALREANTRCTLVLPEGSQQPAFLVTPDWPTPIEK